MNWGWESILKFLKTSRIGHKDRPLFELISAKSNFQLRKEFPWFWTEKTISQILKWEDFPQILNWEMTFSDSQLTEKSLSRILNWNLRFSTEKRLYELRSYKRIIKWQKSSISTKMHSLSVSIIFWVLIMNVMVMMIQ